MYYVLEIYSDNSLAIDNLPGGCVEYVREEAEKDNSLQCIGGKSFLIASKNPVTGKNQISAYYKDEKERNAMVSDLMHTGKDYMKTYMNLFNAHRAIEIKKPAYMPVGNSFQQQLAY